MSARVGAGGEEEQEHARDSGRDGHRSLTADVSQVDSVATKEGSGNTDDRGDGVVAVGSRDRVGTATTVVGKVLRQEGVEERVTHTDGGPGEPDEAGSASKLPAVEERANTLGGELAGGTLDDVDSAELSILGDIGVTTNLVKDLLGQPSSSLVVGSNALNNVNSLGLATTRKQELGRLKQIEEEESDDEHAEGKSAESQDEVTPAPVVGLGTDGSTGSAGEVGNVGPGEERRDQLTNWPPDGEESEEVVGLAGKEFKEQGTIDRKVTANTKSDTGVKSTNGNPAVSTASSKTERTGKEESGVESVATTDDVGDDTPETGTNAETDEEGESCVANLVATNVEFSSDGVQCQGDTLEPEVVGHPAEATEDEKLPLVSAHTHVLDSLVDNFRFACWVLVVGL